MIIRNTELQDDEKLETAFIPTESPEGLKLIRAEHQKDNVTLTQDVTKCFTSYGPK